jgi:hypothetical protein
MRLALRVSQSFRLYWKQHSGFGDFLKQTSNEVLLSRLLRCVIILLCPLRLFALPMYDVFVQQVVCITIVRRVCSTVLAN